MSKTWSAYQRGGKLKPQRTVTADGKVFRSKLEAARYGQLKLLEYSGQIKDIELEPYIEDGMLRVDFSYWEKGNPRQVFEEVKGPVLVPGFTCRWVTACLLNPHLDMRIMRQCGYRRDMGYSFRLFTPRSSKRRRLEYEKAVASWHGKR